MRFSITRSDVSNYIVATNITVLRVTKSLIEITVVNVNNIVRLLVANTLPSGAIVESSEPHGIPTITRQL